MGRKLFCEISPLCFKISQFKEAMIRDINDLFCKQKFASSRSNRNLNNVIKSHSSVIVRKLHGVDIKLQENKLVNIKLACDKFNGIIIRSGEVFSFWRILGNPTKKRGFLEGLVISKSKLSSGIGGGLCQMANMIHLLVLHSPLTVCELHHHSDALFPDEKRTVPFGTGTSISYKNIDYRFKNTTNQDVQLLVWIDEGKLFGELRSEFPIDTKYELVEENHHYRKENGKYYRISQVYRNVIDMSSNQMIRKELILDNHSEVLYDYNLIPKNEIRDK
ncbi:MAG: VanW family protein [Erysipelotrichales bacterium]|nr:VanW family protein [Erysipelotrichales bacterium]